MARLDPPPIQHPIADQANNWLTPAPWALWFQRVTGNAGGGGGAAFGIVAVPDQDNVEAQTAHDTLTVNPGHNIEIETNALGKSLTISAVPALPFTSVQFNDQNVFGGNVAFTYSKSTTTVMIGTGHDVGTTGSDNLLIGSGHQVT